VNSEQIKLLNKMKILISTGRCRFANRHDCDYATDLLELGIDYDEAWKIIMCLNTHFYFPDPKPDYYRKDNKSLTFKKKINGNTAYIKLKIELIGENEETVCLSFHKDNRRGD